MDKQKTLPNYELKAYVLNECSEYVQAIKDERAFCFYNSQWCDRKLRAKREKYRFGMLVASEMFQHAPLLYSECEKIANADSSRRKRLRKRIENMFSIGDCYFLTLTFNDECLSSTEEKTRRVYVHRFLKSVSSHYVGNIDFGKENGREHYHAVCVCDSYDFSSWTHGFYKALKIRKGESDSKRLATYVSKLTNHAIKETTKRGALIYSR